MELFSRFLLSIFAIFISTSLFAGNGNINNSVDCPPASTIAGVKFTTGGKLGSGWLFLSKFDYKNAEWSLVFATTNLNNNNNQNVLTKGQEAFNALSLALTGSGGQNNKAYCVYSLETDPHLVLALLGANLPEFPSLMKKFI